MGSSRSPRTILKENVDCARDEGISSDDSSEVENDGGSSTKIGGAREMSRGGKVVRSLGKDLAFQLAKSASEVVLASRGGKPSRDDAATQSSDGDSSGAREVRSIINREATPKKRTSRDR